ncbi:MAG: Rid family hydrolase [Candidatus Alcyoniella australis]|nr:Rid family hydrolase [Candidatus Alcyoniella australis]
MIKKTVHAPQVLCEAYDYDKPVPFSRGMRLDIRGVSIMMLSGTASVDERGQTVNVGDLRAQTQRMFHNVTELLKTEGFQWHDVVHTRLYLRDIDRNYQELAEERIEFFKQQNLERLPASTCVEARLCRPELLVEIEVLCVRDSKESG